MKYPQVPAEPTNIQVATELLEILDVYKCQGDRHQDFGFYIYIKIPEMSERQNTGAACLRTKCYRGEP